VVDDFAGGARTIGVFLAGRFLGELNMLTGQAMYLTAVVREGGEVLAITRERLKEIVTEEPNLSDVILKAFLARRTYMIRTGLGLRIIGSRYSSDATRLREVAARNRVPHVWIELVENPEAEALLERFGAKPSEAPVTIWQGEDVLKNPTNAEFARTTGTPDPWGTGALCLHRRGGQHRLAPRCRRTGRTRLRPDRQGAERFCAP
jgi:thioredoxin reductase (NADPH)